MYISGLGLNFQLCSEGFFLSGRPQSVLLSIISTYSGYEVFETKWNAFSLQS